MSDCSFPFSPATFSCGSHCATGCKVLTSPGSRHSCWIRMAIRLPFQTRTSKRFARASAGRRPIAAASYVQHGAASAVFSGPLAGLTGIVVRQRNSTRFVISFELLQRSVAVEIDAADLDPRAAAYA